MRDPFFELDEFQRQFERMVEYFTGSRRMMSVYVSSRWRPLVDIYESTDEIRVLVELPGVNREDMQLIFDRNTLLIKGRRREVFKTDCQACHQIEISFGEFERVVDIPVPVDPDGAKAIYRDGFLMVRLPKAEKPMLKRVSVVHEEDEEVSS